MEAQQLSIQIKISPNCIAEKRYAISTLFEQYLGICPEISIEEVEGYQLLLPNSQILQIADVFFKKDQWLNAENLPVTPVFLDINEVNQHELMGMYGTSRAEQTNSGLFIGLDIFASVFFLLSRWEEYIKPDKDEDGRFPAEAAFLVQHKLHQKLWVERYATAISTWFNMLGFEHKMPTRKATLQLSCDMDHPLLWPAQSAWQRYFIRWGKMLIGALLRRRNWAEFAYWYKWDKDFDPYDTTGILMDLAEKQGLPPVQFNFLAAVPPSPDYYYPLHRWDVVSAEGKMRERGHTIGFHPSRAAALDLDVLSTEFFSLKSVFPKASIQSSRQHFLKLECPKTFVYLESIGIQSDSSLGYATCSGFRCGTARPFPMFDFLAKKRLAIWQQPLVLMDVSPVKKQKYSIDELEWELSTLKQEVKTYQSDFTFLWHNSSFYGSLWEASRPVFMRFIENWAKD